MNYQLIDESTGLAPQHIITKREGNNLLISFDKDGKDNDLVIEGFYNKDNNNALIGQAENGSYYYYVPDTGEVSDFANNLTNGQVEGNALGGEAQSTPYWMGLVAQENGINYLPWIAGLLGLSGVAALASNGGSDDGTDGKDGKDGATGPKGEDGVDGQDGTNGVDGQDGDTPRIGDNGNWFIGETDTGIKAQGPKGDTGATGPKGEDGANGTDGVDGQDGKDGTNGVDGQDGDTPRIGDNGNWFIGETDTGLKAQGPKGDKGDTGATGPKGEDGVDGQDGTDGVDGVDGQDGDTPRIGDNGNWFIGETDTGIKAQGPKGDKGADGADGKDGQDGTNGQDGADGKDGINGQDGVDGQDGDTPRIGDNGNWFIGETDTGLKAQGPKGEKGDKGDTGATGADGVDGLTPTINSDGNWQIGDNDTGIKAKGVDGADGNTPTINADGNWQIGDIDTGVKAKGVDGTNGTNGLSAYDIAKAKGFEGTEQEWLDSLKGKDIFPAPIVDIQNGNDGVISKLDTSNNEVLVKVILTKEAVAGDMLLVNEQTIELTEQMVANGALIVPVSVPVDSKELVVKATINHANGSVSEVGRDYSLVDVVAPLVTVDSITNADNDSDGQFDSTVISGTSDTPDAVVNIVNKNGVVVGTGKFDADGNYSVEIPLLANGEVVKVVAIDSAKNTSSPATAVGNLPLPSIELFTITDNFNESADNVQGATKAYGVEIDGLTGVVSSFDGSSVIEGVMNDTTPLINITIGRNLQSNEQLQIVRTSSTGESVVVGKFKNTTTTTFEFTDSIAPTKTEGTKYTYTTSVVNTSSNTLEQSQSLDVTLDTISVGSSSFEYENDEFVGLGSEGNAVIIANRADNLISANTANPSVKTISDSEGKFKFALEDLYALGADQEAVYNENEDNFITNDDYAILLSTIDSEGNMSTNTKDQIYIFDKFEVRDVDEDYYNAGYGLAFNSNDNPIDPSTGKSVVTSEASDPSFLWDVVKDEDGVITEAQNGNNQYIVAKSNGFSHTSSDVIKEVYLGSGDDTFIISHDENVGSTSFEYGSSGSFGEVLDTGSGDDYIESNIGTFGFQEIRTGSGNDTLVMKEGSHIAKESATYSIYTGDGNDTIIHRSTSFGNIDTGDGNDTVKYYMPTSDIEKYENMSFGETLITGNGDDYIESDFGYIPIEGDIDTGRGNDTIIISEANQQITKESYYQPNNGRSSIKMGVGNDTYHLNGVLTGNVDTGIGDDVLSFQRDNLIQLLSDGHTGGYGGSISTGAGNDILDVSDVFAFQYFEEVDMGAGDDVFNLHILKKPEGAYEEFSGYDSYDSDLKMGGGNDTINIIHEDGAQPFLGTQTPIIGKDRFVGGNHGFVSGTLTINSDGALADTGFVTEDYAIVNFTASDMLTHTYATRNNETHYGTLEGNANTLNVSISGEASMDIVFDSTGRLDSFEHNSGTTANINIGVYKNGNIRLNSYDEINVNIGTVDSNIGKLQSGSYHSSEFQLNANKVHFTTDSIHESNFSVSANNAEINLKTASGAMSVHDIDSDEIVNTVINITQNFDKEIGFTFSGWGLLGEGVTLNYSGNDVNIENTPYPSNPQYPLFNIEANTIDLSAATGKGFVDAKMFYTEKFILGDSYNGDLTGGESGLRIIDLLSPKEYRNAIDVAITGKTGLVDLGGDGNASIGGFRLDTASSTATVNAYLDTASNHYLYIDNTITVI